MKDIIPFFICIIGFIIAVIYPPSRQAIIAFLYHFYLLLVEVPLLILDIIRKLLLWAWIDIVKPTIYTMIYLFAGLGILIIAFVFLFIMFNYV